MGSSRSINFPGVEGLKGPKRETGDITCRSRVALFRSLSKDLKRGFREISGGSTEQHDVEETAVCLLGEQLHLLQIGWLQETKRRQDEVVAYSDFGGMHGGRGVHIEGDLKTRSLALRNGAHSLFRQSADGGRSAETTSPRCNLLVIHIDWPHLKTLPKLYKVDVLQQRDRPSEGRRCPLAASTHWKLEGDGRMAYLVFKWTNVDNGRVTEEDIRHLVGDGPAGAN